MDTLDEEAVAEDGDGETMGVDNEVFPMENLKKIEGALHYFIFIEFAIQFDHFRNQTVPPEG